MMLSLGQFIFGMDTLPIQELRRRTAWKHATSARVGARDADQFTGPGADEITIPAWVGPELAGDPASLDQLRTMGDAGESYGLTSGAGDILGEYVLLEVSQTHTVLRPDGSPRRIEFELSLRRVDDPPMAAGAPADWDALL